jgi:hypothetical protein
MSRSVDPQRNLDIQSFHYTVIFRTLCILLESDYYSHFDIGFLLESSMDRPKHSKSTDCLQRIYQCNRDIFECRDGVLFMSKKEQERGYVINRNDSRNMDTLRLRMSRLHLLRHDEMIRVYSDGVVTREMPEIPAFPKIDPVLPVQLHQPTNNPRIQKNVNSKPKLKPRINRPSSPIPVLKVATIVFNKNQAIIDMKIKPTESDVPTDNDKKDKDDDIVYPAGITDRRVYKTVAQYRRMIGKSTDFNAEPLCIGEDQTESAVLCLNSFAEKHGCELMFTDEDHRFDNSIYRAACGIADLGSIHLLATDAVRTASFCFVMDFDFNSEFQQSTEKVETFVTDFCQAIATVLSCDTNNVRVFSIGKMEKEKKKSEVKFGVTSPDATKTEQLAEILKVFSF